MRNFLYKKAIKLILAILVFLAIFFGTLKVNNSCAAVLSSGKIKIYKDKAEGKANNKIKIKNKTTKIKIIADKITYYKKNNKYVITGNVLITRRHFRLYADKVVYFYKYSLKS